MSRMAFAGKFFVGFVFSADFAIMTVFFHIVGKICMDQLAVDVTDIPNVKTGSIATLIGKDGKEEITAPMVAESAESITNELLSRMGHRLNIIRRA